MQNSRSCGKMQSRAINVVMLFFVFSVRGYCLFYLTGLVSLKNMRCLRIQSLRLVYVIHDRLGLSRVDEGDTAC